MTEEEIQRLIKHFNSDKLKYRALKTFEKEKLGGELYALLKRGYGSSNPLFKYHNYFDSQLPCFLFENEISSNVLNVMSVHYKDLSLCCYNLNKVLLAVDRCDPREVQDWLFKCIFCFKEISEHPFKEIKWFANKSILRPYQLRFLNENLLDYERREKAFLGTYLIMREPYFFFRLIPY